MPPISRRCASSILTEPGAGTALTLPLESAGSDAALVPHPHQLAARDRILAARDAGRWGFLLGDRTGLGKTLAAWLAVAAMPEQDILVICPRGAIPHWRRTIAL